jgi:hypothetical protein
MGGQAETDEAGRIHVSEDYARLCASWFVFQRRGEVELEG